MWLVHKDAEEDKDYNLKEMIWMWDKTTIADKRPAKNKLKGSSIASSITINLMLIKSEIELRNS